MIRAALKDPTYRQKYRQFLRRLKQARQEAKLRQVDVAKKLRRPQSFISKCKSGECVVDVTEPAEFARLLPRSPLFLRGSSVVGVGIDRLLTT